MRHLLPSSLTARLVVTVVALVALVAVLVSVATTLALQASLRDQLDAKVEAALTRATAPWSMGFAPLPPQSGSDTGGRGPGDGDGGRDGRFGQGAGTITAVWDSLGERNEMPTASGGSKQLPKTALAVLKKVPADGRSHTVDLRGLGDYRVQAARSPLGLVVSGLPLRDDQRTITNLIWWEVLLALIGVTLAAVAGQVLVRRQLRPLRAVADTAHSVSSMSLSEGEIGTTVRVPEELTDERTEAGQVGAALNTLLAHVEHALDDRHRSELQVRQFVADASHELRTPLTTIQGYAQLTRRTQPPDPDQLTAAMGKVEAEATRMSSLVEDLLLLARLDAGRPLAREEVDLTRLALEAVGDARVVGPDHRWKLDLPDEPVVADGDEQRLHQVLTNLLNNARRHTPPGTSVTVGVSQHDDRVLLAVTDDGPGLPPQLADSAFERFTRGDSARTRASGGAGLGLSLVQAISQAHGGSVRVDSEPGRTRFEVSLPAPAAAG